MPYFSDYFLHRNKNFSWRSRPNFYGIVLFLFLLLSLFLSLPQPLSLFHSISLSNTATFQWIKPNFCNFITSTIVRRIAIQKCCFSPTLKSVPVSNFIGKIASVRYYSTVSYSEQNPVFSLPLKPYLRPWDEEMKSQTPAFKNVLRILKTFPPLSTSRSLLYSLSEKVHRLLWKPPFC